MTFTAHVVYAQYKRGMAACADQAGTILVALINRIMTVGIRRVVVFVVLIGYLLG